ncbi:hypothetical protein M422DRAFT_179377 [Sphaerobolus stellatus SS14]|uniref:Uncharacterized protein n=1 Tax=Sphaerobolus stellatus (strain SS14) TaxID=990650 RepID=A0A0C9VFS5_SPHS4|nr:hypothetical protein M422DRAFT_179377 [Sphaerobolus stellatus SS14]
MSLEDWREKTDILHCNPNFHHRLCYDYVTINTIPVSIAHLKFIFACEDTLKRSWWSRTNWEGRTILEEKSYTSVLLKYLIQGCHLIPPSDKENGKYYVNDLINNC